MIVGASLLSAMLLGTSIQSEPILHDCHSVIPTTIILIILLAQSTQQAVQGPKGPFCTHDNCGYELYTSHDLFDMQSTLKFDDDRVY